MKNFNNRTDVAALTEEIWKQISADEATRTYKTHEEELAYKNFYTQLYQDLDETEESKGSWGLIYSAVSHDAQTGTFYQWVGTTGTVMPLEFDHDDYRFGVKPIDYLDFGVVVEWNADADRSEWAF